MVNFTCTYAELFVLPVNISIHVFFYQQVDEDGYLGDNEEEEDEEFNVSGYIYAVFNN